MSRDRTFRALRRDEYELAARTASRRAQAARHIVESEFPHVALSNRPHRRAYACRQRQRVFALACASPRQVSRGSRRSSWRAIARVCAGVCQSTSAGLSSMKSANELLRAAGAGSDHQTQFLRDTASGALSKAVFNPRRMPNIRRCAGVASERESRSLAHADHEKTSAAIEAQKARRRSPQRRRRSSACWNVSAYLGKVFAVVGSQCAA